MCSTPWTTSWRSSSIGAPGAWANARSTDKTMSPRCGRRPGGSANSSVPRSSVGILALMRREGRRAEAAGNDRTSVGPSWPMCCSLSEASSASSDRNTARLAGGGAEAAVSARRRERCQGSGRHGRLDARPRDEVDAPRWQVDLGQSVDPVRRCSGRRPRGATRSRRSCSAGTRCGGGTCPLAAR